MTRPDLLALTATLYRVFGYDAPERRAVDALVWAETVGENEVLRHIRTSDRSDDEAAPDPMEEAPIRVYPVVPGEGDLQDTCDPACTFLTNGGHHHPRCTPF